MERTLISHIGTYLSRLEDRSYLMNSFIMKNSKQLGSLTEIQCISEIIKCGYDVSIPWGDNCRYDFIIDVNHKLYKVQCKTSSLVEEGVYKFACSSVRMNSRGYYTTHYTLDEVDFFSTMINGQCYLIPLSESSTKEKRLRFVPPKNNQTKGITFATDYELPKQLSKLI